MAEEENKNAEKTWQDIQEITFKRAQGLANLENECRNKLVEATSRYNQALVCY